MIHHDKIEPMTVYIVAGNFQEYQNYVDRKLMELDSPSAPRVKYRYVANVDTIRGLSKITGSYIGTYKSRSDIDDIRMAIAVIKAKDVGIQPGNTVPITNGGTITVSNSSFVSNSDMLSSMLKCIQDLKKQVDTTTAELDKIRNEKV